MINSDMIWVKGSEAKIRNVGNNRSFSENILYESISQDGFSLIIKQFGSLESYINERLIYETLSSYSDAFVHFISFSKFNQKPSLVMRKLSKSNFNNKNLDRSITDIVKNIIQISKLADIPSLKNNIKHTLVSELISNVKCKDILKLITLKKDSLYNYVLVHGDLYPNNILTTKKGQICFIDWEKTMFSVIEKDLATLFVGIVLKVGENSFTTIIKIMKQYTKEYKLLLMLIISEIIELKKIKNFGMTDKLNTIYCRTINLLKESEL